MPKNRTYQYRYPRPALTVDLVIVRVAAGSGLEVLLIERRHEPFAGSWALPGGFVDEHEDLEAAARRELDEETGARVRRLRQIGAFGKPGRDPRGHTVSVAYLAALRSSRKLRAGDDASAAEFWPLIHLPKLAFDHRMIIGAGLEHLRRTCFEGEMLFDWMPKRFGLDDLRDRVRAISGQTPSSQQVRAWAKLPWILPDSEQRFRFDRRVFRQARHGTLGPWIG
ncbi:MAG: NUDIX hydrolase [Planctomycetes bacterium]|nr:NUDIX hydrolase [Planctomycetota bacterium]